MIGVAAQDQSSAEPASGHSAACPRHIWIGSVGHVYVDRVAALLADGHVGLEFKSPGSVIGLLLSKCPPIAWDVQWVDVIPRRTSTFRALEHAAKFVLAVLIARLRKAQIIWTCHNLSGKAHDRLRLDRAIRSFLVLNAGSVIVLTKGAVERAADDLPRWVRRRFLSRVRVVPHPLIDHEHGPATSVAEARKQLGVTTSQPLLAYLPGANQVEGFNDLLDPDGRYEVLSIQTDAVWTGVQPAPGAWVFGGRPTDREYGLLISAADAVLLTDQRALGSRTAQTATLLRRPLVGPNSPALEEIAEAAGAVFVEGEMNPDSIAESCRVLRQGVETGRIEVDAACRRYCVEHSDDVVRSALIEAYERAGVTLA